MNLEQRISFIKEKLLAMGDIYACTMAARDCLLIIEVAFRELLRRHADKLLPPDRIKLQKMIDQAIKGSRAKGIDDFTLGQLVGIIRDANFFDAWSTATGKPLTGIRWIELNNLNSYRNERLVHVRNMEELLNPELQVTPSEANFLLYCLSIILETFGIESLENPPVTTDEKSFPHALSQLLPNPYRGLEAFREQDVKNFFGRDEESKDLAQLVEKRHFVAVLGNSGSGKSSLVFAGLIPQLRENFQWLIATCRPQKSPLREISVALIDALYQTELNEINRISEIKALTTGLEQQTLELIDIIARIFDKHPSSRLLLIVDQFEELYTLSPTDTQSLFLNHLLTFLEQQTTPPPVTVLITLRADFLGYALGHAGLAKLLDTYRNKMLGNLSKADLLKAIEQPARALNVSFEDGLIERIVRDVGETGSLPLLQFALQQLWERRTQNRLTHAGYEALGTVTQALAHHADRMYEQFSEVGKTLFRQLFVQMVRPGEGTEDTRQVMVLPADPTRHEIVRQLANERLVVTRHDEETGKNTVEIAHEALIRHWQRLKEWMKEDRSFRVWQENLRGYMRDQVLLRDAQLAVAQEWSAKRDSELTEKERDFIQKSVAQRNIELTEYEEKEFYMKEELKRRIPFLMIDFISKRYTATDGIYFTNLNFLSTIYFIQIILFITDKYPLGGISLLSTLSIMVYSYFMLVSQGKFVMVIPYLMFYNFITAGILVLEEQPRLVWILIVFAFPILILGNIKSQKIQQRLVANILVIVNKFRKFRDNPINQGQPYIIEKNCPHCKEVTPCFTKKYGLFLACWFFFMNTSWILISFIIIFIFMSMIAFLGELGAVVFFLLTLAMLTTVESLDRYNLKIEIEYKCLMCATEFKGKMSLIRDKKYYE